jgi:hypothetical protein
MFYKTGAKIQYFGLFSLLSGNKWLLAVGRWLLAMNFMVFGLKSKVSILNS